SFASCRPSRNVTSRRRGRLGEAVSNVHSVRVRSRRSNGQLRLRGGYRMIRRPQITLYSRNLPGVRAFYESLGFRETFRYPDEGPAIHVEFVLDGFILGIVDIAVGAKEHGFDVNLGG